MYEMEENVALEKKHQGKFAKKIRKVKERVQVSGNTLQTVTNLSPDSKRKSGTVYLGHIPHGFYEDQMLAYFKQFGKVKRVRLCRSQNTGRSKGYAFIEFANAQVAEIAAETMNNYLMFNRRLVAKYIPGGQHHRLQKYKLHPWSTERNPLKESREKANWIKNKNISETKHSVKCKELLSQVNKTLKKLQELGIMYSFHAVDKPRESNETITKITSVDVPSKNTRGKLKKNSATEVK